MIRLANSVFLIGLWVLMIAGCNNKVNDDPNGSNGGEEQYPPGEPGKPDIWGSDDRLEPYQIDDPDMLLLARSVGMLTHTKDLSVSGNSMEPITSNLGDMFGACDDQQFARQPTLGFCTGFLAAPDIFVTAGHCNLLGHTGQPCDEMLVVFDYAYLDKQSPEIPEILSENVYQCEEVLLHEYCGVTDGYKDFAILRLDRPVEGRAPLKYRRDSVAQPGEELFIIGHPSGLPMKFAMNGQVQESVYVSRNSPRLPRADGFFFDLDVFAGNSGGPIFNARTKMVEGIAIFNSINDWVEVAGRDCSVVGVCGENTECRYYSGGYQISEYDRIITLAAEGATAEQLAELPSDYTCPAFPDPNHYYPPAKISWTGDNCRDDLAEWECVDVSTPGFEETACAQRTVPDYCPGPDNIMCCFGRNSSQEIGTMDVLIPERLVEGRPFTVTGSYSDDITSIEYSLHNFYGDEEYGPFDVDQVSDGSLSFDVPAFAQGGEKWLLALTGRDADGLQVIKLPRILNFGWDQSENPDNGVEELGDIAGIVYESGDSSKRVDEALVWNSQGWLTLTDERGAFEFSGVKPIVTSIYAASEGFQVGAVRREVMASAEAWARIGLVSVDETHSLIEQVTVDRGELDPDSPELQWYGIPESLADNRPYFYRVLLVKGDGSTVVEFDEFGVGFQFEYPNGIYSHSLQIDDLYAEESWMWAVLAITLVNTNEDTYDYEILASSRLTQLK